jgi:hypothetical protein
MAHELGVGDWFSFEGHRRCVLALAAGGAYIGVLIDGYKSDRVQFVNWDAIAYALKRGKGR